jgi:uncharacterized protein YdiU (UPF0061 family)
MTVFSSIDQHGRYAYANQPGIGQWNLARLGEALLPLVDADKDKAIEHANAIIKAYGERFHAYWLQGMRGKIGLTSIEDGDLELIQSLLALMQAGGADFTLTFRRLSAVAGDEASEAVFTSTFREPAAGTEWLARWRERLSRDPQMPSDRAAAMKQVNPAFIARNHRVEQAIEAAVEDGDFSLFEALLTVLSHPYEEQPAFTAYMDPPKLEERVLQTFCGT